MKEYHIVYKEQEDDFYSKGVNITANDPIQALAVFYTANKDNIFICMHTRDIKFVSATEPLPNQG
jgi:hypothetical protein